MIETSDFNECDPKSENLENDDIDQKDPDAGLNDISVRNIEKTVSQSVEENDCLSKTPIRMTEYYEPSYETKDTNLFDENEFQRDLVRHQFEKVPSICSANKRSSYCSTNKAAEYRFYNPIGTDKNSNRKYYKDQKKKTFEEFHLNNLNSQKSRTPRLSGKLQTPGARRRGNGSIALPKDESTFYNEISHSYWNFLKEKGRMELQNRNSIASQNYICSTKSSKPSKHHKNPRNKKKKQSCPKRSSLSKRKASKPKTNTKNSKISSNFSFRPQFQKTSTESSYPGIQ